MPKIIKNGVTYIGTSDNAAAVSYDNTSSGLTATNVQGAIDEVNAKDVGDINDVNITSVADGNVLAFDGTSNKWVNFDLGAMKSASTTSANPVTCADSKNTEVVHITLDKGLYLFIGYLGFNSNATGDRGINISTVSGDSGEIPTRVIIRARQSGQTRFQTVSVMAVSNDNTTFYLNGYQTSGGTLDVIYSRLLAVKIGK